MRVVIQKVDSCTVIYKEEEIRSISEGYVMYVGIERGDSFDKLIKNFEKIFLELIPNDINKDVLILSQFTLFADLKKNKPNFYHAEVNYIAKDFFYKLVEIVKNKYKNNIQSGIFGEFLNIKYTGKHFNTTFLDFNF